MQQALVVAALVILVTSSPRAADSTSRAHATGDAPAPSGSVQLAPAAAENARALEALFDEQWEFWMRDEPTWASGLGDRRYNDRWPERSRESFEARDAQDREILEKLRRIDRTGLTAGDLLDLLLFERKVSEDLEERAFRRWLIPLDHMYGFQTQNELSEELRFETVQDYEDWIARLRGIARVGDQNLALMREGVAAGLVPPRVIMDRVPAQLAQQVVERAEDSPFYRPFRDMPAELPAPERDRLAAAARAAIAEVVVPTYRKFQAYFAETYLPAARATVGASALPDGRAYYAFRVRNQTTTTLTPQQIHDIGLAEVARIRREMDSIIRAVGFSGDFQQFLVHLRSDPRFYAKSGEELLQVYRATAKRIDPELVKLFGRLPRIPYGVKPIPEAIAPNQTTAYYNGPAADGSRAGIYWANLYRPETRPLFEVEALTLHEAVPGHHLQISLAQELGELPKFRRHGGFTAFVEGWGLYAESLGEELGMYQDPHSKFGQLTYEMWRAVRLVVDTGMHEFGWSRERAIEFFKANAAKSEHDIVNEIDRYIAWPGQALAYKVGELRIKELRHRAEERLGEGFDVRAFHDVVLGSGAVPLDVLERNVDDWMERARLPSPSTSRP